MRNSSIGLALVVSLVGCGRPTQDADVRLVGVGADPDEIGPSPDPYGGVVEYDHVELAGAGLSLAHMGLGSYDEVGPWMIDFAPPYSAIIGFSYLFDTMLPAADTLAFVGATPPVVADTCYTAFSPEGPIGSFTTVDVGDYMEFVTDDGSSQFRMSRVPADYPPDPQDMFIYYSSVEEYAPYARNYRVPAEGSSDPLSMIEQVWRPANYPFGQLMTFQFPGGLSRIDQPVGSIPLPSSAAQGGATQVQLPSEMGGVLFEWDGPRFDKHGEPLPGESWAQCLEYYGERDAMPTSPSDCDAPAEIPTSINQYNSFDGQIYTAPWDTTDGKLKLKWNTQEAGDQVVLTVRFMAKIDESSPDFLVPEVDDRPAGVCEEADADWVFDPYLLTEDGETPAEQLTPALHGDPFSRMAEVTCLLADDGEHDLDASVFEDAREYALAHDAGGVVFFFSRGSENEVEVPAVKDSYDQRHDISPIKVTTRTVRIGRFHWEAAGGEE